MCREGGWGVERGDERKQNKGNVEEVNEREGRKLEGMRLGS